MWVLVIESRRVVTALTGATWVFVVVTALCVEVYFLIQQNLDGDALDLNTGAAALHIASGMEGEHVATSHEAGPATFRILLK
jgi:hypothetical protein